MNFGLHCCMHDSRHRIMPVPLNSSSLHCMWSDRKNRLSFTHACEFFFFLKGGPTLWPLGLSLDPCSSRVDWWPIRASFVDPCLTGVGPWLICGFLWSIGELFVGTLLDSIGFLGHFVIGFSVGIVCVIAML